MLSEMLLQPARLDRQDSYFQCCGVEALLGEAAGSRAGFVRGAGDGKGGKGLKRSSLGLDC